LHQCGRRFRRLCIRERSGDKRLHGCRVIQRGIFKDLPRPSVFHRLVLDGTDNEPTGRTTHRGQFDFGSMDRWNKTQVYIDRFAGFVRRAVGGTKFFFAGVCSGVQSPASIKMRFTVFGLSNGSHWLALASSSAIRRLPHLGF